MTGAKKKPKKIYWARTGMLWPFGVPIGQSWLEIGAVLMTVQEYDIRTVYDIGVNQGGLSLILATRSLFIEDFYYIGVEIDEDSVGERVLDFIENAPKSRLIFNDVFKLPNLASNPPSRPMLIICDGGDKPREFQTFAPKLRHGDFIMAHDCAKEIKLEDCIIEGVPLRRYHVEWLKNTTYILFDRGPDE